MSFQFNNHNDLKGKHALLSASKYHWIRYDTARMADAYHGYFAAEEGTKLHDLAAHCVTMGQKLQRKKKTINMYVNDAVDEEMKAEQPLYYSQNFFGTADAISFRNGILKIFDFKSGAVPAHEEQLYIYAALFCLEYGVNPEDIQIELRIYQSDEVHKYNPDPAVIREIMDKGMEFDAMIEEIKLEEAGA